MDTTNERGRPSFEWYGNPPLEDLSVESLAERGQVATAAKDGNWAELLDVLETNPSLVNSSRPGGHSWFTPLHQAAYHNASEKIVLELIGLGAFRTLKSSSGERPVDIARRKGFDDCADLLEPAIRRPADPLQLAAIQELLHGLVRAVSLKYRIAIRLRLPELSVLTEFDDQALWFPIPDMYGGFNIWLEEEQGQSVLIAESWCRVVDGSGMRHRITPKQVVLVEEGFV
jgi:hypothetical protein